MSPKPKNGHPQGLPGHPQEGLPTCRRASGLSSSPRRETKVCLGSAAELGGLIRFRVESLKGLRFGVWGLIRFGV